jgi:hypothetical protein
MNVRIALCTCVVALCSTATAAAHTMSLDPCTFLSARQVAAVHVDTACTVLQGKPNPLYAGVTGTWGKLAGRGSVIVAVERAKSEAYITFRKTNHVPGKSWGVGSWSRGSCTSGGTYCYVSFIVGKNIVMLQVAAPQAKPVMVTKPTIAMAKAVAAKLT